MSWLGWDCGWKWVDERERKVSVSMRVSDRPSSTHRPIDPSTHPSIPGHSFIHSFIHPSIHPSTISSSSSTNTQTGWLFLSRALLPSLTALIRLIPILPSSIPHPIPVHNPISATPLPLRCRGRPPPSPPHASAPRPQLHLLLRVSTPDEPS